MSLATVRRVTIFAVIFGGLMAVVVWLAGGIRGDRREPIIVRPGNTDPGSMTEIAGVGAIGRGAGVRVTKDAVAPVDGRPVPYRVWAASWEKQAPRDGSNPDEHVLLTEEFLLLLFHAVPTAENPRPAAVEGPNSTRIEAGRAEWDGGAAQKTLRTDLFDGVIVTHHSTDGDLVLRTERLFVEEVVEGARERQIARTDAPVTIEQSGLDLSGTGLDLQLDARPVTTLRRDVRAEFVTSAALIGAPSAVGGETEPAVITCSGPARLEALDRARDRNSRRRWKATFDDDVYVVQGGGTLRADHLEIEFLFGGDRKGSQDDLLLVVADGNVVGGGADSGQGETWTVNTPRMRTTRGRKAEFVTTFGRGTTMHFSGILGDGNDAGSIEIHSAGPATLTTDSHTPRPDKPVNTRVRFTETAVFRQRNAAGELTGEVEAPEILLLGKRVVGADGRVRPVPDALTATGDAKTPVHVLHRGARATSRLMSWTPRVDRGLDRVLLNGTPVVHFDDPSGWNPLGAPTEPQAAVLELAAGEEIELRYLQVEPAENGQAAVEQASAHGRGGVALRRLVDDEATYRLDSDTLDVAFDDQGQPAGLRAYGSARLQGRGEGPDASQVDLSGDRIRAQRLGTGEPGDGGIWTETELGVYGSARAPAVAAFEVAAKDGEPRRSHEIRAHEITYEQQGTVVVARRDAVAHINRRTDAGAAGVLDDAKISGGEIRAEIAPRSTTTGTTELIRLVAKTAAIVWTKTHEVVGDEVVYDHRAGTATVTGRPARAVMRERAPDDRAARRAVKYESKVVSPRIVVEFDGRLVGSGNAEPRRVRCDGGRIVLFDDSAETEGGRPGPVRRTTVVAAGPILVQRGFASAERDVEITVETLQASGRWRKSTRLTCERATLDIDPEARGDITGRVRRATAVGTRDAPVRAETGNIVAIADKVELAGQWIHVSSPLGRLVLVEETAEDGTVTELVMRSGWWNFDTYEWDRVQEFRYR